MDIPDESMKRWGDILEKRISASKLETDTKGLFSWKRTTSGSVLSIGLLLYKAFFGLFQKYSGRTLRIISRSDYVPSKGIHSLKKQWGVGLGVWVLAWISAQMFVCSVCGHYIYMLLVKYTIHMVDWMERLPRLECKLYLQGIFVILHTRVFAGLGRWTLVCVGRE